MACFRQPDYCIKSIPIRIELGSNFGQHLVDLFINLMLSRQLRRSCDRRQLGCRYLLGGLAPGGPRGEPPEFGKSHEPSTRPSLIEGVVRSSNAIYPKQYP